MRVLSKVWWRWSRSTCAVFLRIDSPCALVLTMVAQCIWLHHYLVYPTMKNFAFFFVFLNVILLLNLDTIEWHLVCDIPWVYPSGYITQTGHICLRYIAHLLINICWNISDQEHSYYRPHRTSTMCAFWKHPWMGTSPLWIMPNLQLYTYSGNIPI